MPRIKATCPRCGEIDLQPADITLMVIRDDGELMDGSCYGFNCPECRDVVKKPVDDRVYELLAEHGGIQPLEYSPSDRLTVEAWPESRRSIAEPREQHPETPPQGPPFTQDDLLDFHELLQDTEQFKQWLTELELFEEHGA